MSVRGPVESGREQQLADGVDAQHRRVVNVVSVSENDADAERVELDVGPGGEAVASRIVEWIAVGQHSRVAGDDAAGRPAVGRILADQRVDALVRAIGLALVDQQTGLVDVVGLRIDVVGGAAAPSAPTL